MYNQIGLKEMAMGRKFKEYEKYNMSDKYKNLMFIPIILICVSLYVIGYNAVYEKNKASDPELMVVAEKQAETEETSKADAEKVIDEPIDINSATIEELTKLPNIGEKRAQAIIDLRKEMRGFRSVDEIVYVKGIGAGVAETIKEYIIVLPYNEETDR